VPGDTTRPITDRAKEALFSILGQWMVDARVLDLFSGTGAVGIEALSRGAAHVTFDEAPYFLSAATNLEW
jgi:16S rRNA (guanine966-N2)-methyltransferase